MLDDLVARLTLCEDHLRETLPERAMVIHLGEAEVFVGQMPQLVERSADAERSAANLLEEPLDALGIQLASVIAGCAKTEKQLAQRRK